MFLRRMLDIAHSVKDVNHYVKLKSNFKSDLAWWECFLEHWNGLSMMESIHHKQASSAVWHTDASGTWGCVRGLLGRKGPMDLGPMECRLAA